ncbi:MAG TPA: class I SAM-dependent methyltransferase [Sphingomonas sp.]|nr:class I SAM-dependent methyltransferase [Sphingomonas sp.]
MFIVKLKPESAKTAPYDPVGHEYYDPRKHPTCDVFGEASAALIEGALQRFDFRSDSALCDLGAGRSVLGSWAIRHRPAFGSMDIVDQSETMLAWSEDRCPESAEFYLLDAEQLPALGRKFDLVVASLADPFNTETLWRAVEDSLAAGGQCLFTTPSFHWATTFRDRGPEEMQDAALFELSSGARHYVPSYVYRDDDQVDLVARAGLRVTEIRHATRATLTSCPPKLSHLTPDSPVITLFRIMKA